MMPRGHSDPPPEPRLSRSHVETTVREAHAEVLTVIGSIHQNLSSAAPPQFSIDSTAEVTSAQSDTIEELFVANDRWIEDVLSELEKRRILLLYGEHGCGKSATALYLAARLSKRSGLRRALLAAPPDPDVEVDLRKIACDKDFASRALVFTDVFAGHNDDLAGFFSRGDALTWERLTADLREQQSCVIFTTESEAIFPIRQRITGLACREILPLDPALVERGFARRVSWLERHGRLTPAHVRQLSESRERLIDDLKTLPRLVSFLDQFTVSDGDVDAALQRFHDIPFWFSRDLAADVDAWCFALTLALAHSVRPGPGVGWYAFDRIRRTVTAQIREEPEFLTRTPASASMLSDDFLLSRARAEVIAEPSRLGAVVRFIDSSYGAIIWQTAAARHRRVLTALIPALRAIAEGERGPGSHAVRSLAAQMIGRIGELDPFSISIPLVQQEWLTRNRAQRPYVGHVLKGMRMSSSRAYRQAALSTVDALLAQRRELPTVIAAYALIGEHDPSLSMSKLGLIATQELAPQMSTLKQVEQLVENLEQHASRAESDEPPEELLRHRSRLEQIAKRLSTQHAATLVALEQAVSYLCLTTDPVVVLCAMREWISHGGATLVALLFLNGGIAERVAAVATDLEALTGSRRANRIVRALSNRPGEIEAFATFLAELYAGIHCSTSLAASLRRDLLDRFAATLTAWAAEAAADRPYADAVQSLFLSLINSGDNPVHSTVATLLDTQPFTASESMRSFAAAVQSKATQEKRRTR